MIKNDKNDIKVREDRIGKYFRKYLDRFIFAEFSEEFISKSKAAEVMGGVPVPLKKEEVREFAGGEGISMNVIAENMAWVMGCDPHFKHASDYAAILSRLYDEKITDIFLAEGMKAAECGDMDNACIHFRAVLCVDSGHLNGMYSYARACRAMYLNSSNEEYIGRFKAEALNWFEMLTELHPDFAQGHYYLGYAYLNMGLYSKADISWKRFIKISDNGKDKKEIEERLVQLKDALDIEAGYNHIIAGRYEQGIEMLEPFISTRFVSWWPLHYYLGIAYEAVGNRPKAVAELKQTLRLNGSHLETMKELTDIYKSEGDEEKAEKYSKKIAMIELAMEEDRKVIMEEIQREDEELQRAEPQNIAPEMIDIKQ